MRAEFGVDIDVMSNSKRGLSKNSIDEMKSLIFPSHLCAMFLLP